MRFRSTSAHHFRLLRNERFDLHPDLNYIIGGNGAGKTTVLEAIYVLGRGHSHRNEAAVLVQDGEAAWSLEGSISTDGEGPADSIQVRWERQRLAIQLNHQPASVSELVRLTPILMIDPLGHRIMDEGPGIRRRFIDWGVFHMEHRFQSVWARMNRALRQRNAGLRRKSPAAEVAIWNHELIATADTVTVMREHYIELIRAAASRYWSDLLGAASWTINFNRGWKTGHEYAAILDRNFEGDSKVGFTREGPHRAELQILSDNRPLRDRISRGQQKLLIAGLMLAQGDIYKRQHGHSPVLLIDDFAAELSPDFQQRWLTQLAAYIGQKIVTSLEFTEPMRRLGAHHMFHMEHGRVSATTS